MPAAAAPELEVFRRYLADKGLKQTSHRRLILETFLAGEGHRSVEDIHREVRQEDPRIGYTTVYRTMKLLSDSGLAREIDLSDGMTRYEHLYNHAHHDHLLCTSCGRSVEFFNAEIEKLQDRASAELGFRVVDHRLQIYGLCGKCRREPSSPSDQL
jgi:Fur family ferric uptake transcriptional regulator